MAVIIAFQSATLPKTFSFRSENMPKPQRDDRLSTPTFRVIFPVGKAAQGSCGAYSPGRPGTQVHEKFETASSLNWSRCGVTKMGALYLIRLFLGVGFPLHKQSRFSVYVGFRTCTGSIHEQPGWPFFPILNDGRKVWATRWGLSTKQLWKSVFELYLLHTVYIIHAGLSFPSAVVVFMLLLDMISCSISLYLYRNDWGCDPVWRTYSSSGLKAPPGYGIAFHNDEWWLYGPPKVDDALHIPKWIFEKLATWHNT